MIIGRSGPRKIIVAVLIFFILVMTAGCKQEKVVPKKIEVVEEPPVEEVFENMEDEEMAALIEKVRTYAETFDIGTVDKEIKGQIKAAVPKGTKEADALEPALVVIDEFMEVQLKLKIAEGLDEYVGKHTEEDILLVYEEMNTSPLIKFILHYEIERLKLEGYLR